MKKYFLLLFTLLSLHGYCQTKDTNPLQKILIGKWQDELSTFTLFETGSYIIQYNSGSEQKGTWSVKNFHYLTFKPTNSPVIMKYSIIDYSSGDFGYTIIKKGKESTQSYHAVKLKE